MNSWKLGDPSKGDIGNAVSDGTTTNFTYPCTSSSDCTYYYSMLPAGYYKVEVWGARGGRGRTEGKQSDFSRGGYSVGVLELKSDSIVYVFLGGSGEDGPTTPKLMLGGFNGGGDSPKDTTNNNGGDDQSGSGGGSSDIRVGNADIDSRVIVAGGAGHNTAYYSYKMNEVGFGGGIVAGPPKYYETIYRAADQTYGYSKEKGEKGRISSSRSPSGGGGGGYWCGYTADANAHAGGGSGYIDGVISIFDIVKQSIPGNETITLLNGAQSMGNPDHGAARITAIGYSIKIKTDIEERYDQSSKIKIKLEVNSVRQSEQTTVYRQFNNVKENIHEHTDDGVPDRFYDEFDLPAESGSYELTYSVCWKKQNTCTSTSRFIFVNTLPIVKNITNFKSKYREDQLAFCDFEIISDKQVYLIIENENSKKLNETLVLPNDENRIQRISFVIPFTQYYITNYLVVYARDNFLNKSEVLKFEYVIVPNLEPEILMDPQMPYTINHPKSMMIFGQVKDVDTNGKLCVYSTIDQVNYTENWCNTTNYDDWIPFHFVYPSLNMSLGVHIMQITAKDNLGAVSEIFHYKFAILNRFYREINVVESCQCKNLIISNMMLDILMYVVDTK